MKKIFKDPITSLLWRYPAGVERWIKATFLRTCLKVAAPATGWPLPKVVRRLSALILLLPLATAVRGEIEIDVGVVGLFNGAAMISVDGRQQMLRAGQTSKEGVLLVSANSSEAVVEINGEQITLGLSQHIGSSFRKPESRQVVIQRRADRYGTAGAINDRPVSFVVDTGATIVAMNSLHAISIGLDLSKGRTRSASTASGTVGTIELVVDSIQVGEIRVNNVAVAVMPGRYPEDILLGMSFLKNVQISEESGVMTLTAKY